MLRIFASLLLLLSTVTLAGPLAGGMDTAFGSRAAGPDPGGHAAWSNPALLSVQSPSRIEFSYGWLVMDPSFRPIEGITLENSYTGDRTSSTERVGSVADDYRSTIGQSVGASVLLAPGWHDLTAGVSLYSPFDQLAYVDTGETYLPEYVLYRAGSQRPQLELGLGGRFGEHLHLGAGVHFGFGVTASGTLFMQANAGKPSTMRVSASVKPKASPTAGWLYKRDGWSLGQVIRLPNSANSEINFNSSVRAFGDLAALDVRFGASSSLFYDPLTIETGWSWQYSSVHRLILQVDLQGWRSFEAPTLSIRSPEDSCTIGSGGSSCSGLVVSPGIPPAYPLQNIVIPRIAEEWTLRGMSLRAGYAYRPSIFASLPTGSGNALDPPRHMASLGAGWKIEHLLGINVPIELDAHLSFHQLVTQRIQKSPLTESGEAGTKIGAPGYLAGGQVWGGGASLSMAL